MKFTLHHRWIKPDPQVEAEWRRGLARLASLVRIERAEVVLERSEHAAPPYRARVHLVIPGPDLHADGADFTLRATVRKVLERLTRQVRERQLKQAERHRGDRLRGLRSAQPA